MRCVPLQERTAALGGAARMQIGADQGALMTMLTRLVGARQAVEVGTFTGFSSICIARGLAPDGRLLCCDVSEEYTAIARQAWAEAGVADRIDLRVAPALETLRALPADPTIDLAFIDADKGGYAAYFEELVPRVAARRAAARRQHALVGPRGRRLGRRPRHPSPSAPSTTSSPPTTGSRATSCPVGDGLTLIRKR